MHLRYDLMDASLSHNESRHAQVVMRELGITYQHATPQSIAEQWWFWNCENVPDKLPSYITKMQLDPLEQVGWGLDQETAEAIAARALSEGHGK